MGRVFTGAREAGRVAGEDGKGGGGGEWIERVDIYRERGPGGRGIGKRGMRDASWQRWWG